MRETTKKRSERVDFFQKKKDVRNDKKNEKKQELKTITKSIFYKIKRREKRKKTTKYHHFLHVKDDENEENDE